MRTVLTLALKLANTSFVLIDDKKKASGKKQAAFFVLLLVLLAPNIAMFGYFTYDITKVLITLAQEHVVLALLLQLGVTIIIFSSVFMIPSYLFYAKDIEKLLPLPLTHAQLFCAKMIQIHIYQIGFLLLMVLPPVIGFILAAGFSLALVVFALTLWINAVITLVITSLVLIGVMSVSPWFKNKDAVTLVLSLFSLGLALYVNMFIGGLDFSNPETIALSLLAGQQSLSQNFTSLIPYLNLSVSLVTTFDWLLLFIYLGGCTLFIYAVIKLMASTLVTIMASFSGTGTSKKMTQQALRGSMSRSVILSLLIKELKLLFRTPIYFFNNVLVMLVLPFIMIFSFSQSSNLFDSDFTPLVSFLQSNPLTLVLIAAGLSAIFSTMNLVTPTSISREGTSKFHMLLWPVSMTTQVYAKFLSGVVISLLGIFPTILFLVIANILLFDIPLVWLVLSIVSMLIIMIFINIFGMVVDVYNPKLVWENEQAAVKQNINFLFTFLGSGALIGLMTYVFFNFPDNALWIILALHGACIIAIAISHRIIVSKSLDLLIEH